MLVGTTDTQTLTNKTLDGVSPTVMGYLDATSSIQTQLNGKAATNASTTGAAWTGTYTPASGKVLGGASPSYYYYINLRRHIYLCHRRLFTNTTGTATNLSGTPALPNGTTGTTQTTADNTTKLATDAFVQAVLAGAGGGGGFYYVP